MASDNGQKINNHNLIIRRKWYFNFFFFLNALLRIRYRIDRTAELTNIRIGIIITIIWDSLNNNIVFCRYLTNDCPCYLNILILRPCTADSCGDIAPVIK